MAEMSVTETTFVDTVLYKGTILRSIHSRYKNVSSRLKPFNSHISPLATNQLPQQNLRGHNPETAKYNLQNNIWREYLENSNCDSLLEAPQRID